MKLRDILAAGVATIAFAGVASANDLVGTVGGVSLDFEVAAEQTGDISAEAAVLELSPSGGGNYLNGNQVITLDLNGATINGATFNITGGGTCLGNFSLSSGGGAGDDSVVVLADTLSGCDTLNPINITFDTDVANNTDVTFDVSVTTEAGTPVGGGNASVDVLEWTNALTLAAAAASPAPEAQLPDFLTLDTNNTGTVTLGDAAGTQYDVALGGDVDIAGLAGDSLEIEISGDFSGIADVNGTAPVAGVVTIPVAAPAAGALVLNFNEDGTNAIAGGNFPLSVDWDLGAGFDDKTASATLVIDREGSDLYFPYTLDGATVDSFPGTIVSYRISNRSNAATGTVTLQMKSWDSAPTDTGMVTLAASIPANGDLVFTPAQVEALVGSYGVGDFIVNVEADGANLQANYAMINSAGTTNYTIQVPN